MISVHKSTLARDRPPSIAQPRHPSVIVDMGKNKTNKGSANTVEKSDNKVFTFSSTYFASHQLKCCNRPRVG